MQFIIKNSLFCFSDSDSMCCQLCFHAGRGEQEDSAGPEDGFGRSAGRGEKRGGEEERAPAAVYQRQMCLGAGES